MCVVQRVLLIHSSVSVMDCVFRHVSSVMATHNAVITVMKATALASTVSSYISIMLLVIVHCDLDIKPRGKAV